MQCQQLYYAFFFLIEGLDVFLNFSTTITLDPGVTFLPLHLVAISDGLYEGDDETITLIGQTADGETRVEIDADSAEVSVSIVDTDSKYTLMLYLDVVYCNALLL